MTFLSRFKKRLARQQNCKGFTLVELMIGTAVSAIVMAGAIGTYTLFGRTASIHRQIATMMENQRGAFSFMELNVRMAGYDVTESGLFGISNLAGGGITMSSDLNSNGVFEANANATTSEQLNFFLYDDGADGVMDLGVNGIVGVGPDLVAEGIQAIGFAFAIDNDGDGIIDVNTATGNTIWAADTDLDGILDANLDSDGDGDVDINDAPNGSPLTTAAPSTAIRMVRIWMLAQTLERAKKCTNFITPMVYVVGNQRINDPNDCFRRRISVQTFECKNMGL